MSVDYRKPVEVVDKDEPEDVYEALLVRPLKGWFNSAIVVWSMNGTIEHANTFDGNGQPVRGGCGYFVRNKVLNDMRNKVLNDMPGIRMSEIDDKLLRKEQEKFEAYKRRVCDQVYRDKPTYRDTDGSSIYPAHPLEPPPYQNRWFNPITKEWEYFE